LITTVPWFVLDISTSGSIGSIRVFDWNMAPTTVWSATKLTRGVWFDVQTFWARKVLLTVVLILSFC